MSKVWIGQEYSYNVEAIQKALHTGLVSVGVWNRLRDAHILIKPNLTAPVPPHMARTTHPKVVQALCALCLEEAGAAKVTVAESCAVGFDTQKAYEVCGYSQLYPGVSLLDLKGEDTEPRKASGLIMDSIPVYKPVLEADVVFSVAKLKTIFACPVSLTCKNMKGVIPDREKKLFHRLGVHKGIADLLSALPPILPIIDGITGLSLEEKRSSNVLFVGDNPVSTDAVAAEAMGIGAREVQHLQHCAREALGSLDLSSVEITGLSLQDLSLAPFKTAAGIGDISREYPVEVLDGHPCSGCVGALKMALKAGMDQDLIGGQCLGLGPDLQEKDQQENTIIIGNCSPVGKGSPLFIPGCPPESSEIIRGLREAGGRKKE